MASMEELTSTAIKQAGVLKKPAHLIPWKNDEPWEQSYFAWNADIEVWQPNTPPLTTSSETGGISTVSIYSWNIDFMLPLAEARMDAAMAYLESLTSQSASSSTGIAICLQECHPSDLSTISQKQWVRERFYITDLDSSAWGSNLYGTTMLVDRRLNITSCFRVHYAATTMERDALFVDVTLPATSKKIRLGNSHLESLPLDPPQRPSQMRVAAKYLHATPDDNLAGAVIVGDFNAIQPFDTTLHSDNNLKDAFLELGGREGSDEGFTWGQQALPLLRERFGCSRMDKAYFCGSGFKLQAFERFGADVEVQDAKKKDRLLGLGFEKAWVTDHLGVKVTFTLTNDTRL